MRAKRRAVLLAIAVALLLTAAKVAAGLITMSISMLSSALDSFMDACSMLVTMAAVATAEKPPDEAHPFGHGKAEAVGGLVQALLIAISAGFLIFQAIHRIVDGYRLEGEMLGIVVTVLSLLASIIVAARLQRVGSETESTALMAGALNFRADILSYVGVLLALVMEKWFSVKNADPIISILISLGIAISALRVGRDAIAQLMDRALPEETLAAIEASIRRHAPVTIGCHRLCTRRVGQEKFIEFHLEIDRTISFESAHQITEDIIADIRRVVPGARVTVHSDPR